MSDVKRHTITMDGEWEEVVYASDYDAAINANVDLLLENNKLRAELAAAKAERDRLAMEVTVQRGLFKGLLHSGASVVTREQFGYVEGADNTIPMALYGDYVWRLASKESEAQK